MSNDFLNLPIINVQDDILLCSLNADTIKVSFKGYSEDTFKENLHINLINTTIKENIYYPTFIILEPKIIVNITDIAKCAQDYGESEIYYFISLLKDIPNTKPIRLGSFANLALDELITNKEASFEEVLQDDFRANALQYTACKDIENIKAFKEYMQKAQIHFANIKTLRNNIVSKSAQITIEPSYALDIFGIKGRLDILIKNKDDIVIIELKSGKAPFGDKISEEHLSQLYLYYVLICYCLKVDMENIRGYMYYSCKYVFVHKKPKIKYLQNLINIRNKIVALQLRLQESSSHIKHIFAQINYENLITNDIHPNFKAYMQKDIENFVCHYDNADDIAKAYVNAFLFFVFKERWILYTKHFSNATNPINPTYDRLDNLIITQNNICTDKTIVFKRTMLGLCNIRAFDMVVLSAQNSANTLKGTIAHIDEQNVIFKATHKQFNADMFIDINTNTQKDIPKESHKKPIWSIRKDISDILLSFGLKQIYAFLKIPKEKRDILLGKKPAVLASSAQIVYENKSLLKEQNRVIQKALNAKDYFILNAPAGSGKTSIIIKNIMQAMYKKEQVLLLGYTHKAIEQICDAIKHLDFIRIGEGRDKDNTDNVLTHIIKKQKNRQSIKKLIQKCCVFVSTISYMSTKYNLISSIKSFDVIIVDEASQVLEPMMITTILSAKKFILIGDINQLPAISLQNNQDAKVNNDKLNDIGLQYTNISLFERLYKQCHKNNWNDNFDTLCFQGRMHKDIQDIANKYFYTHSPLKTISDKQNEALNLKYNKDDYIQSLISQKRALFFNHNHICNQNKNDYEAKCVCDIIKALIALYELNSIALQKNSIGVITPFRNQIANIKDKLAKSGIKHNIIVDTVERYQGGCVDNVILSFSVNNLMELNNIVSLNNTMQITNPIAKPISNPIDRKLNVALTRAKERFMAIGNKDVLNNQDIYKDILDFIDEYCLLV